MTVIRYIFATRDYLDSSLMGNFTCKQAKALKEDIVKKSAYLSVLHNALRILC